MYRNVLACVVVAGSLTGTSFAQTPTWKLDLLGAPPPGLTLVAAAAVNDTGLVVGNGYESGWKRAWIAGPGLAPEILPLPPTAEWSEASDVNAAGVVVGSVLFPGSVSQGVLWIPGPSGYDVFVLPSGPGGHTPFNARGINDAGDVVGKYGIFGGSYHWSAEGGITQIPTSTFPKVPYDVNEQRQIIAESYRMDLDTFVLEDLGNPTETPYNYVYTELTEINDAGEGAGYAVVATGQPPYLPVRYTDGPVWKLFNSFPWTSASVTGLAATGDVAFQLGASFGKFVYVEGFGSIALDSILDAAYADWDLTGCLLVVVSRGGLIGCTAFNSASAEGGVVLLTPVGFDNLGGAAHGALGDPVLTGYGSTVAGQTVRVRLASAAPNSVGRFLWSTKSDPIEAYGGTLYANPPRKASRFETDALGRFELTFDWPSMPPGTTIYLQMMVVDPEAEFPVSLSNALVGVTQ